MKTLQKTLLALTAGALLSTGANAAINYTAGQPYVGVKVGQFDSKNDNLDAKKQTAYGAFGGYQFDENWGTEIEYLGSKKAGVTFKNTSAKGEMNTKTYGIYGTYKYNFATTPVYAKVKLGIAKTEIAKTEVEAKTTTRTVKADDTGLAYGVGLGFQATPAIAIEAEYAKPERDTNLWTVGANFKF